MPVYQVIITKSRDGEKWDNTYHLEAADFAEATLRADALVDAERVFHHVTVYFEQFRVATMPKDGRVFITTPIALYGQQASGGELLPIGLCVRVDFATSAGDPGRKYYHLGTTELEQSGGIYRVEARDEIASSLAAALVASPLVVVNRKTGNTRPVTVAVVQPKMTWHQFHKRRRKKDEETETEPPPS